MADSLYTVLREWEEFGIFDIVLPFLLVFTVIFAILQSTKILGKGKNINTVVALVLALLVIQSETMVATIRRFLPNVALAVVVILMFLLFLGIFIGEHKPWTGKTLLAAVIIAVAAIFWSLSRGYMGTEWLGGFAVVGEWLQGLPVGIIAMIILIVAAVLVVVFAEGKGGEGERGTQTLQAP